MTPAIDAAPGAEIPAATSGVAVAEDAEPDEALAESDDPEEIEEGESWLLVPPVLEVSVAVTVLEAAVPVDVPVKVVAVAAEL